MADFHAYTLTVVVPVAVPAMGNGDPQPVDTSSVGQAVRDAVGKNLRAATPGFALTVLPGLPEVTLSTATAVDLP